MQINRVITEKTTSENREITTAQKYENVLKLLTKRVVELEKLNEIEVEEEEEEEEEEEDEEEEDAVTDDNDEDD